MVQPSVALRLVATACLLAGVAFAGSAMAKPGDTRSTSPAAKVVASAEAAVKPTIVEAPSVASAALKDDVPACARKVKVIYAGYGEADRAACAISAKVARD